ncbi:MAG: hypothetical protein AAGI63_08075 [Planctomycetota bacterium]
MSGMSLESQNDRARQTLQQSLTVCVIALLAYLFTTSRIEETIRTAMAALLFASLVLGVTNRRSLWLWPLITLGFLVSLLARPLDVPNHHWMMTYLSAAIGLSVLTTSQSESRIENLQANARWLVVVLMAFATMQKVLSPAFIDGTYIGFELARGGFAGPIVRQLPFMGDVVAENASLVQQLHTTSPATLESVTLTAPFASFPIVAYGFTASILMIEAWLCFAMLLIPKRLITHLSLISFIVTLAVLRQEVTFISVVCCLGLFACGRERPYIRAGYALLAVVTAAAVLKTLNVA